jgi:hypothetical protein
VAKPLTAKQTLVAYKLVVSKIAIMRGQRVMFSHDLAELYGVEPKVLMQAVQRNMARFPADFVFQLSNQEFANLKSQIVTSSWGGVRKLPYAFTEQGVAMLSSVLRSERAVAVNIEIMRTFVRMRELLETNKDLAKKIAALENKYDEKFKVVFDAILKLMDDTDTKPKSKRKIGFV